MNTEYSKFAVEMEILFPNFGKVPIYGGWGYSKEDAIIINKYDPMIDNSRPFNGIGLEYALIQHRNWFELIIHREVEDRFREVDFDMLEHRLIVDGDRLYDFIEYELTAFKYDDYREITDYAKGHGTEEFDENRHLKMRAEKRKYFKREIWFEISSFYGEDVFYDWDLFKGPFFFRTDGTPTPVIPPDPMELLWNLQVDDLRSKEKKCKTLH